MNSKAADPFTVKASTRLFFVAETPGTPVFDPPGPFGLERTNTLRIALERFPPGSTLTSITLTSTSDPRRVVHFPPLSSEQIFSITCNHLGGLSISAPDLVIGITDTESPKVDDTFELSVRGEFADGTTWNTDPEVINMPGG